MKVLVALADSRGEVVARDQLVERCWDGRIVGDDAVNRCIVALRNLVRSLDPAPFVIETFPRVGYRLVATDSPEAEAEAAGSATHRTLISRRSVFAGLSVAALGAAVGGMLWAGRGKQDLRTNAEAMSWYEKGLAARDQGLVELYPQVQANLRETVRADPDFAEGWSALALAYMLSTALEQHDGQQQAFAERAIYAARRALEIDPDSLEARATLALVPSEFGRWAETQETIRNILDANPDSYLDWLLRSLLAYSLSGCGRCRDALEASRSATALKPEHPSSVTNLIYCLWAAGELNKAETESERASARYPSHAELWLTRMALLTYSGRPATAIAFAERGNRPLYVDMQGLVERRVATAQALVSRNPADIERVGRMHVERFTTRPLDMMPATRFFATVGQLDTVFEICEAYYFNTGRFAISGRPARNELTRLDTISLFWPPMAPVWADSRFAPLTERIGLSRYWQDTGSSPDFRRAISR